MVEENFATYQQNYDFDAPSSPYRETEAEYIFGLGDEMRNQLKGDGWSTHELNMYASNQKFLEAVFHESPLKARTSRATECRREGLVHVQLEFKKNGGRSGGSKLPVLLPRGKRGPY
jgi:hypothetical protein